MKEEFLEKIQVNLKFTILLSFFLISSAYSQTCEITRYNGEKIKLSPNDGYWGIDILEDEKITSSERKDSNEEVRLIVTFKDEPVKVYQYKKAVHKKVSLPLYYSSLKSKHSSFRSSMKTIQQNLSKRFSSDFSYIIRRDYYHSLNGVAIVCKRGMIDEIRTIPMVKNVTIDQEVSCNLKESIKQIKADFVRDSLGITGKGVLVGNIDTGMDYNNPALGGGLGSGYRVIGGYDFTNNDNDPMDDHGHGTHVAGIIGANSDTLKGVAPDVNFIAVKVLGADGKGSFSDLIAGIEYCLDPDGNPETDDAVDVINMSLGGPSSIENPVDSAVNNVAKAGILSIIAAGNNGNGPYTWGKISSPGTSETALTVGACDSSFNIASFSSSGPDPNNSFIKPEVVAPGVNILSTILNNQTASWSGTSMATPHVTGLVALLKEEHPQWEPGEIKATIINTARLDSNNVSIFIRGNGCINALEAAHAKIIIEPGILNFGVVDLELNEWKDTVEIKITNHYSYTKTIKINVLDGLPSGATIEFDKSEVSIAANSELFIKAILKVPSTVPVLANEPFAYTGNIEFVTESEKITTPFSFSKSSTLIVNFDLTAGYLLLVDKKNATIRNIGIVEGIKKYKIPVASAYSLDIFAGMIKDTLGGRDIYLVKHFIDDPTGLTYINLNSKMATINVMDSVIYDVNNNIIKVDTTDWINLSIVLTTLDKKNNTGVAMNIDFSSNYNYYRIKTCPLDSNYLISKRIVMKRDSDYFDLRKRIIGISNWNDIKLNTGSENLIYYNVKSSYNDPCVKEPTNWVKAFSLFAKNLRIRTSTLIENYSDIVFETDDSNKKVYYNNCDTNPIILNKISFYSFRTISFDYHYLDIKDKTEFVPRLLLPDFEINEDKNAVLKRTKLEIGLSLKFPYQYDILEPGDTLKFEQYNHVNFPDYSISLLNGSINLSGRYHHHQYFVFPDQAKITNGIKQSNGLAEQINQGVIPSWSKPAFSAQTFSKNNSLQDIESIEKKNAFVYYRYNDLEKTKLHISTNGHSYTLLGQNGQSALEYECNLPEKFLGEIVYPTIENIQVNVNGKTTKIVKLIDEGKVRLNLFDPDSSVNFVEFLLLSESGEENNLPVNYIGNNEYNALIPNDLQNGFVDVVARFEDNDGNKGEMTLSPGFYFGDWTDKIISGGRVKMASYHYNKVDTLELQIGDTLDYTLAYTNYGSDVAKDVNITFPTSNNFEVVGSAKYSIDSLIVGDTVNVPVQLIVKGKENADNSFAYYKPSVVWNSNAKSYSRTHKIVIDLDDITTGIKSKDNTLPEKYALHQNYPNPFNPSTTIKYDLPKQSRVKIEIYNVLGKRVATLLDAKKEAGRYQVNWNAARYASGVYFCTLRADDFVKTKKLVLLK